MTTRSERASARAITTRALRVYKRGLEHGPDWGDDVALDEQVKEVVGLLGEGIFSRRALSAISNISIGRLRTHVPGGEAGGIVEPSTLPLILDLLDVEDERDGAHRVSTRSKALAAEIVARGTSPRMLSALSAVPVTTLRRWAA